MKKYTYVTLLTNDSYFPGVVILYESLRRVNTSYPLLCLITNNVSENIVENLIKLGIKYKKVATIPMPDNFTAFNVTINEKFTTTWKDCFTKFYAFELTEYDKVIFCDADLMFLKNCDHCFEMSHMTAALDGEYSNHWPDNPHFNAGFMVIKPEKDSVIKLLKYISSLDLEDLGFTSVIADQEILNLYYTKWPQDTKLHLSKYYNVFPNCSANIYTDDILKNGYFVHFVGVKPWEYTNIDNVEEPISNALLIFSQETTIDSYCLYFYELAYSIFDLSRDNSFNKLDWQFLIDNGVLDYAIALCSWQFFKDIKTANSKILLAIEKDKTNKTYLDAKLNFITIQKVGQYIPLIRDAIIKVYKNINTNTLNYFRLMHLTAPLFNISDGSGILPYSNSIIDYFIDGTNLLEEFILKILNKN